MRASIADIFFALAFFLLACGGSNSTDALFDISDGSAGGDAAGTSDSAGNGGTDGGRDGSGGRPCESAGECPVGQFCDVLKGCVKGIACSDTAQCIQKLGDDACKTSIQCDPANAICTFQTLDKDHDGHPPVVCGGDDCDDSDPSRFPGAEEICDGKDNGCDGKVDVGATCIGMSTCKAGVCTCPPSNTCGAECVDKTSDPKNCGTCGNECGPVGSCTAGVCKCSANAIQCSNKCTDIKSDPKNCGACGTVCSGSCQNGMCAGCSTVSDLYVLQDISGSMGETFVDAPTKYDACKTAVTAFLGEPTSQKLGFGMGFWPLPGGGPVPPTCAVDIDCGPGGVCLLNMCVNGTSESCTSADFAKPSVAIAPGASVASSVASAYAAKSPSGTSCPPPGLTGALSYLKSFASGHAGHKVGLILIADGEPTACGATGMADLVPIAEQYATGTPPILTYVIGLPNAAPVPKSKFDSVASAGGTGSSYMPTTTAELTTAFRAIHSVFKACP